MNSPSTTSEYIPGNPRAPSTATKRLRMGRLDITRCAPAKATHQRTTSSVGDMFVASSLARTAGRPGVRTAQVDDQRYPAVEPHRVQPLDLPACRTAAPVQEAFDVVGGVDGAHVRVPCRLASGPGGSRCAVPSSTVPRTCSHTRGFARRLETHAAWRPGIATRYTRLPFRIARTQWRCCLPDRRPTVVRTPMPRC